LGFPVKKLPVMAVETRGAESLTGPSHVMFIDASGKRGYNFAVTAPISLVTTFTHMQIEHRKSLIILKSLICV
jgi:hypothetical protein